MKRIIVSVIFVLAFCITAFCHPPKDIIISFDLAKSTVKADIIHDSKNIAKHYIKQVEVKVNGVKAITQQETTQVDNEKQTVIYVIAGLKAGDRVSIDADCSIYGDLTKEAVVQAAAPAVKSKAKEK